MDVNFSSLLKRFATESIHVTPLELHLAAIAKGVPLEPAAIHRLSPLYAMDVA